MSWKRSDFRALHLGYSSNPWRVVHVPSCTEVWFESKKFDHPESGLILIDVCGYRIKREAEQAIDRLLLALEKRPDLLVIPTTRSVIVEEALRKIGLLADKSATD